jgi:membrane protease YdiL (CAAX protease family)
MKRALPFMIALAALVAASEALILARVTLDPLRVAALLTSLALTLTAFVGLTISGLVKQLRHLVLQSPLWAVGLPFSLLGPYMILALGTGTFSFMALLKLSVYIALPTLLLLPERLRRAERIGWRDIGAIVALAVPVSAGWLGGIWVWPADHVLTEGHELYLFRPMFCVCVGAYDFLAIRNLDGVGFRLGFRRRDIIDGLANFAAFALLAIPLGHALGFIAFRPQSASFGDFALQLFGIYLTIAIPEELLFRGILQNSLVRSLRGPQHGLYGLLIAAAVFGAAHLHHAPAPNWRYAIMATLAGIFYGNAYRTRQRLSSPALTHALVDTVWHFWF